MATRSTTTSAALTPSTSTLPLATRFARRASGPVILLFAVLIAANIAAWLWALAIFRDRPALLGTALLAWVFGLRHAVDADHIAAIDNVVRKLMQQGKRPVTVGLFFSLGHSTVVFAAVVLLVATAAAMKDDLATFRSYSGAIGISVSAIFLLLIAIFNLFILRSVWRAFRAARNGTIAAADDDTALPTGIIGRIFRPLFRVVTKSWHMYGIGLLFGLGFDTATEIGLLSFAGTEAVNGVSPWHMLVFPALFTAGMALVDTADSALMVGAYGWAFVKPIRKLWYNLTITAVSVAVALLIGSIEALSVISEKLELSGGLFDRISAINRDLADFGFVIVGVFIGAWILSATIYWLKGYDRIGATAEPATPTLG
ncbi:HoxN/HupN/NixA family nickel/cobalt transporter [Rhodopseudomonas sp. P2A-2r]|uniref:HoxN/HupN/NixA family nickel/cobalt transporter n=1 Tax=unclassified Rhodopseudomonas TaxID=2638247 RepID=UPI00223411A6|nr:HoxN/HupN/NixA family nickel/cobalt transporter [Rhodopseudomonas sp. P2A-2r]UZE50758.1 HoxN/HupN/NixA family nickel/cobalt transporter [Rhodopseudomonas sp. P2A-2r]